MAYVRNTFSGVGAGAPLPLPPKGMAEYSITNTFSGGIQLEFSGNNGQSWEIYSAPFTDEITGDIVNELSNSTMLVRWRCVSYASGSPICVIEHHNNVLDEMRNPRTGQVLLQITDNGIRGLSQLDSSLQTDTVSTWRQLREAAFYGRLQNHSITIAESITAPLNSPVLLFRDRGFIGLQAAVRGTVELNCRLVFDGCGRVTVDRLGFTRTPTGPQGTLFDATGSTMFIRDCYGTFEGATPTRMCAFRGGVEWTIEAGTGAESVWDFTAEDWVSTANFCIDSERGGGHIRGVLKTGETAIRNRVLFEMPATTVPWAHFGTGDYYLRTFAVEGAGKGVVTNTGGGFRTVRGTSVHIISDSVAPGLECGISGMAYGGVISSAALVDINSTEDDDETTLSDWVFRGCTVGLKKLLGGLLTYNNDKTAFIDCDEDIRESSNRKARHVGFHGPEHDTVADDDDVTWTTSRDARVIQDTATLTAHRDCELQDAFHGSSLIWNRTGGGAFNRVIKNTAGTTILSLATGESAMLFNNGANPTTGWYGKKF